VDLGEEFGDKGKITVPTVLLIVMYKAICGIIDANDSKVSAKRSRHIT
jgi:hypothetical protein